MNKKKRQKKNRETNTTTTTKARKQPVWFTRPSDKQGFCSKTKTTTKKTQQKKKKPTHTDRESLGKNALTN